MTDRLTLREAREQGRLSDFAEQADREARDTVPVSEEQFDAALGRMLKAAPTAHRTSGSPSRGGSTDNRIRRGKAAASRG